MQRGLNGAVTQDRDNLKDFMGKRFTDTDKWKDPWFRKLKVESKVFWGFLTDNCDQAGYWKKDYEMAGFLCGFEVGDSVISSLNTDKCRVKDHGIHLEVLDFVSFQYGHLSHDCRPHRPILDLLEKYKKKGYQKGINTLEEQEKEKEKEKRGVVRGGFKAPSLEEVKTEFDVKGYPKAEAEKFIAYFDSVGWVVGASRKPMKNWRGAVATWCGKLRDSGVRPKVPQAVAPKVTEDFVPISDSEREALIKSALPNYAGAK